MWAISFQPGIADFEARCSTEHQLALTLEAMGHTVVRLQEDTVGWDVAAWTAERCSLLLRVCTWNVDPDGAFACLRRLRHAGVPTVSYHLDLFWGLASRRPDWIAEPFFASDWVFTADSGHDQLWQAAGVNHRWLPPGVFEPHTRGGTVREAYARFPIVFVGSFPYPHPEWTQHRRRLIGGLKQTFGNRFRVYTGGVRGQNLSDLYASAAVVVGDSCLAGQTSRFWSDRVPETLGRGALLLHPWVDGLEDWYTDGAHLRLFEEGDVGAVCALVDHYLACPEEAGAIGAAGRALVRSRDTYTARMQAVLDTVLGGSP